MMEQQRRAGSCESDIMCLDHVPRNRQNFPHGCLLPYPHEAQHLCALYIRGHPFERDSIFTFTT